MHDDKERQLRRALFLTEYAERRARVARAAPQRWRIHRLRHEQRLRTIRC